MNVLVNTEKILKEKEKKEKKEESLLKVNSSVVEKNEVFKDFTSIEYEELFCPKA